MTGGFSCTNPTSPARQAGASTLEVEVTNLRVNRLIGDEQQPDDCEWDGWNAGGPWITEQYAMSMRHKTQASGGESGGSQATTTYNVHVADKSAPQPICQSISCVYGSDQTRMEPTEASGRAVASLPSG